MDDSQIEHGGDDFDLLGKAVARVLRDAFAGAAQSRASLNQDVAVFQCNLDEKLDAVFAEVGELRARAQLHHDDVTAAFDATLTEARNSIETMLAAAVSEADGIRAQAVADARSTVERAGEEIDRARRLVAEERMRLDGELNDLLGNVQRSIGALERSVRGDHSELIQRATSEARMILRQARLHHRATAREVDRMIEAAATEAAALRDSALADAARLAARVRGVVLIDGPSPEETEAPAHRGVRPMAS
jgi:F0F1-type ATP synthase membrane subunit b/b'